MVISLKTRNEKVTLNLILNHSLKDIAAWRCWQCRGSAQRFIRFSYRGAIKFTTYYVHIFIQTDMHIYENIKYVTRSRGRNMITEYIPSAPPSPRYGVQHVSHSQCL